MMSMSRAASAVPCGDEYVGLRCTGQTKCFQYVMSTLGHVNIMLPTLMLGGASRVRLPKALILAAMYNNDGSTYGATLKTAFFQFE